MPRFKQTPEILKLMGNKERIRNIGVIAHIDHGKTTMTDSLLAEAGLLPSRMAGSARALDYLEEEQKRGITIKTANISLLHETSGQTYVINLIDTPGHVDFTGKVTRALRAIDGAVVVVDAVEEIMAQTETVTRQALEEKVKPVLFINKVDRLIREMKLSADEIQSKFSRIIRDFNNLIEVYGKPDFKDEWKVDAQKESVAFGSALDKWGFTFGIAKRKGVRFSDVMNAYEKEQWRELLRLIPLHDAILDMAVKHVPSPAIAQKYRIPRIWRGELNSEIGQAMLNCDENGPTSMCITNVQTDAASGLVATGRLFSGSVKEDERVYLVGSGKEYDVRQVSMYMGAFREAVNRIPAGNIAALSGLELARAGETVVDVKHEDFMVPFEPIRYVSEPIVTIAVEPKSPRDLQRLVEAMNRLSIEDPNLATSVEEETGQYLISGMGELHLEIALKSLKQYSGIDLVASNPIVAHRETVQSRGAVVMAKSLNKQNAFWVQVEPLEDKVLELMEKGGLTEETELERIRIVLQREADYGMEEAERVWALDKHGNMLLNLTVDVSNIGEVRNSIISGFHWACKSGPLCEEPLRGVKVKLTDAKVHEEPGRSEPSQAKRAVSRAILGSTLTANPCLLEPVYRLEVSVPTEWMGTCAKIITRKRGKILAPEKRGILTRIVGYVPVAESFGLATEMRSATSGRAFWQSVFDHWEKTPETVAKKVIRQTRQRRGLPPEIPKPDKFADDV